ncbi:hypothetical protein [Arenimonas aestuarii]
MATENVAETAKGPAHPFEHFDQSCFREWIKGVSDVLMNCDSANCDPASVRATGGLIYQLASWADEIEEIELQAQRAAK